MSEHSQKFVKYLVNFSGGQDQSQDNVDRRALATLRHSLAFAPGQYTPAYPYVEPFVGKNWYSGDSWRLALYAVAGLFARHPHVHDRSLATAFGQLWVLREKRDSIEKRFIALLGADADAIFYHLRQAVSLFGADKIGLNYGKLLDDLKIWLNHHGEIDRIRQNWARDFYQAVEPADSDTENDASADKMT